MHSALDATQDWCCEGERAFPYIMTQYLHNALRDDEIPTRRVLPVDACIQCALCWMTAVYSLLLPVPSICSVSDGEIQGGRTRDRGGCCGANRGWDQAGLPGSLLVPLE